MSEEEQEELIRMADKDKRSRHCYRGKICDQIPCHHCVQYVAQELREGKKREKNENAG